MWEMLGKEEDYYESHEDEDEDIVVRRIDHALEFHY